MQQTDVITDAEIQRYDDMAWGMLALQNDVIERELERTGAYG